MHFKLTQARSRLVTAQPFLAVLALRMGCIPDKKERTPTIATDGYDFHYNEQWVEEASLADVQLSLASCALHAGLLHTTRRGSRDQETWDKACDYAVNSILRECGYSLHAGSLYNPEYAHMSADEIYTAIYEPPSDNQDKNQESPYGSDFSGCLDSQTADRHSSGQKEQGGDNQNGGSNPDSTEGDSQGEGGGGGEQAGSGQASQEQIDQLESELKENFAQAIAAGKSAGNLPGMMDRLAQSYFEPAQVDWKELLRAYMIRPRNDEYTWNRGNRRYLSQGLYLPTQRGVGTGEVVVCIDTSGSLTDKQLQEFADEINDIVETVKPEKTTVLYCDTHIQHVDEFKSGEQLEFKAHGGGGTDFHPPFKWIEDNQIEPEVFVYCTDGYCNFPEEVMEYPTIWVVNSDVIPPWGEHVPIKSGNH